MNWLNLKGVGASWDKMLAGVPSSPIVFLSPLYLLLLLVLPLAVAAYILILRRRKKMAVRFGNFGIVKTAVGPGGMMRRHIPPALFLAALALMIAAVARPAMVLNLQSNRSTVILAMDVSGSMRASDIKPSRIVAAQSAAKQFITAQPRDVQIGIVAFAATALLVQGPTTDREALNKAIDRFELQRGTAVGSSILASLSAIFPDEEFAISGRGFGAGGFGETRYGGGGNNVTENGPYGGGAALGAGKPAPKKAQPVEPGSFKSAVVILLTDGATTTGVDPVEAARQAADHGVRVYTVGFGTPNGDVVGWAGRRMRTQLDEDSLKKIADMTRAQYHRAGSSTDLNAVYAVLSKALTIETRKTEITALFAAIAAALAMVSAALSLWWFNRIF